MFQVIFSSAGNVTERFNKLTRNFEETREGLAEIAELLARRNEEAWAKDAYLTPETVDWKSRRGQSQEPLVETGQVKDEVTHARLGTKRLSNSELVFGSNAKAENSPVAVAHLLQHGTGKMSPKTVLHIDAATRLLMQAVLSKTLTKE